MNSFLTGTTLSLQKVLSWARKFSPTPFQMETMCSHFPLINMVAVHVFVKYANKITLTSWPPHEIWLFLTGFTIRHVQTIFVLYSFISSVVTKANAPFGIFYKSVHSSLEIFYIKHDKHSNRRFHALTAESTSALKSAQRPVHTNWLRHRQGYRQGNNWFQWHCIDIGKGMGSNSFRNHIPLSVLESNDGQF